MIVTLAACSTQDNLGNHLFGEPRWSRSFGSTGDDRATAIAFDAFGNVLVAGTCEGDIDFGSGAVECQGAFITQRESQTGDEQWTIVLPGARITNLTRTRDEVIAAGTVVTELGIDAFIATFDRGGNQRSWSELGLAGVVVAPVAAIAEDGRVFSTGGVPRAMPTNETVSTSQDTLDAYVSSHYRDGTHAWTKPLAGDGRQLGTAIAANGNHELAVIVDASAPLVLELDTDDVEWPAQLLLRFSPQGEIVWSVPLEHPQQRIALTSEGEVVVAACPSSYALDREGNERWRASCKDSLATVDSVSVSSDGLMLFGGHHDDAAGQDGELFLIAFDLDGNVVASARTLQFPEPSDTSVDALAMEPTGELVFVLSASHPFDLGNGALPHAGAHDVVVAKLDSTTGRDGQVVLTRTAP
jgi:hypothetical protein